jgi:hypothetical protein
MITTRIARTMVAALAAGMMAAPAASADTFELSVGAAVHHLHAGSVDALTPDDAHAFLSIHAGAALDRFRVLGMDLRVDGAFERGGLSGISLERLESDATITSVAAGASLIRRPDPRVAVFGRAALGLGHASLRLRDRGEPGWAVGDSGYAGTSYLGVGADVAPLRLGGGDPVSVAVGLRLEAGYLASSSISMRAHPLDRRDDGTIYIPERAADLGALDLSAWTYRIALVGRF